MATMPPTSERIPTAPISNGTEEQRVRVAKDSDAKAAFSRFVAKNVALLKDLAGR
jgi:hypothetical protein